MKYSRIQGQGNYILWILNHPSTGLYNYGGAYAHYGDASGRFYTEWDDADIRKQLWDKIDFGLGPNTLVSKKYVDQNSVEQSRGAGNDLPIYRYSEVLLQFAEADCRVAGGPTPEGIEALNKVHRRAYGYDPTTPRSEEHTSELQSLMRISYAVFCLKKKKQHDKTVTQQPKAL